MAKLPLLRTACLPKPPSPLSLVLKHTLIRATLMIAIAGLMTLAIAPTARALEIQAQTNYQLFEVKPEGQPIQSSSSIRTTYNLGFRGPLTPYSNLQSFFTMNSSDYTDRIGEQSIRNVVFNLISRESTHTLTGSIDRSDNHSATSAFGVPTVSKGQTTNYNVNLVWSEQALPVVNLQYRQSSNSVTSGINTSNYSTGTWLTGAYYEYSPLRFTFDRQQQSYEFSGRTTSRSETIRSRFGVNFEQRLLSGLNFTADFSKDSNETSATGFGTSFGGTSSVFRLTATPTRSVVLTADRSLYKSHQSTRLLSSETDSVGTTLSLRSEILPGLSLGITSFANDQTAGLVKSKNKNLSASLGAVLTRDTTATLGWNKSSFDTMPQDFTTSQHNTYLSLRTPLAIDTDLNIDFGLSDSQTGVGTGFSGKSAGFIIRNMSLKEMSLGFGYHWNVLDQRGSQLGEKRSQSIDFDIDWLPSSTLGIDARVGYYVTGGTSISEYISPTIDIRWQPSTQSNLTLRYDFNRSRLWDPLQADILGQSAKGLSARFSYRINQRSSFDITYDYQAATASGFDFQRALRLYFRTKL
ncbi:MAG: hypothetical protein HYX78_06160 [Armatimonadetes bacterium]|nr:hypothetical protein [Armatimonadota bacterium]